MDIRNIPEPVKINEEEYLFLSENLDALGIFDKAEICSFLSISRRHMLSKLLRMAIDEELDSFQQNALKLTWFDGLSASKAAEILGVNRSTVTRQLNNAYDKLRKSLKYVMLYQFDSANNTIEYYKEAIKYDQRH